jgi:PTH1 family peptidyl-tRNA hydrolase
MGFMAADRLAEIMRMDFSKRAGQARVAVSLKSGVIIAKPVTYMNLSGESVAELIKKYNLTPSDIVVIYDDIDLPKGATRMREKGSAGTHNGMRNIVARLGTQEFIRVRIGIGGVRDGELRDYVLSPLSEEDRDRILPAIDKVANAIRNYLQSGNIEALKTLNVNGGAKKEVSGE